MSPQLPLNRILFPSSEGDLFTKHLEIVVGDLKSCHLEASGNESVLQFCIISISRHILLP